MGTSFLIFFILNNRYEPYYGNWQIRAPKLGYYNGYLITNISISKKKNHVCVFVKGTYGRNDWGPLLFIAKRTRGILKVEPSTNFKIPGQNELSNAITQPFKIYYSHEHDRIIACNVFFMRSKVVIWNF